MENLKKRYLIISTTINVNMEVEEYYIYFAKMVWSLTASVYRELCASMVSSPIGEEEESGEKQRTFPSFTLISSGV